MSKINLTITGCMGRMGQQLIRSANKDKSLKIVYLTENFLINKRIGLIKAELNIEPHDEKREKTQLTKLEKLIENSDLDKTFITNLMKLITTESKKKHEQIKKEIGE